MSGAPLAKARLFSPFVKRSGPYCIRFFYHANGNGMGKLNLFYLNKGSAFGDFTPPLSVAGRSYGDQWIGAQYQVNTYTAEKQFILEAVRGTAPTSFVALDEVSLTDGPCNEPGTRISHPLLQFSIQNYF